MKSKVALSCDFCHETGFRSLQELKTHRRYKCPANPNRVKPRKPRPKEVVNTYICSYCQTKGIRMVFSSSSKLNRHIVTEHSKSKQTTLEVQDDNKT
jgi:hypothetical protein